MTYNNVFQNAKPRWRAASLTFGVGLMLLSETRLIYNKMCPANEWTKIIFDFGRGYREKRPILFVPVIDQETIVGEYKEIHYNWIFPKEPIYGELKPEMDFYRRWIDGIYSVWINPKIDVNVAPR